jgi:hypothetical protein
MALVIKPEPDEQLSIQHGFQGTRKLSIYNRDQIARDLGIRLALDVSGVGFEARTFMQNAGESESLGSPSVMNRST